MYDDFNFYRILSENQGLGDNDTTPNATTFPLAGFCSRHKSLYGFYMINDRNKDIKVYTIQLTGRDRVLSTIFGCVLGLFLPLGLVGVMVCYHFTGTFFLIIVSVLFLFLVLGFLIKVLRNNKEEMNRVEFRVNPEELFYLNHYNGKSFSLNWNEIRMIRPVLFYNYKRRLDIIPIKGKIKTIDLKDYTFRLNPYALRRSIVHYSGRDTIWKSKGPLFLW